MQWRFEGSYIPFADTPSERVATRDPRRLILERYPDWQAYVAAVTEVARVLVDQGLMLQEDVARCASAAAHWNPAWHSVSF